jgi:hypothetical protein
MCEIQHKCSELLHQVEWHVSYLLLSDVDRFVKDNPRDRLVTGRHCS